MNKVNILRGDVFIFDFGVNDENTTTITGRRPVVVVQNNTGNLYSPNIIACALTSTVKHRVLPTHVPVPQGTANLLLDSTILTETPVTISKKKLSNYIGNIGNDILKDVDKALMISLGITSE